jgi:hypothetical protein
MYYRDPFFAVLFFVNVVVIVAIAFSWGIEEAEKENGSEQSGRCCPPPTARFLRSQAAHETPIDSLTQLLFSFAFSLLH